jgi:hypothetical protein
VIPGPTHAGPTHAGPTHEIRRLNLGGLTG